MMIGNSLMDKNKKVLFHAPILEFPPKGGPEVSVINAIKALSHVSDVYVTTTVSCKKHESDLAKTFFALHCQKIVYLPTSRICVSNNWVDAQLSRLRRFCAPLFAILDVPFIIRTSIKYGTDVFWIDRVLERAFYVLYLLRKFKPSAVIVGDTEAVQSRFILRELPMIESILRRCYVSLRGHLAERHEKSLTSLATYVTAVSSHDANYFRSLCCGDDISKVVLFSNSVDLQDYQISNEDKIFLKKPSLLLMGSFGSVHSPMDRAAKWLASEIMPLVWEKVPAAHLYVVGKNSDITQSGIISDRISVLGSVDSMLPYMEGADICVVPLGHESGTRFKIIQAGAAAMPCVSTTLGAEGLDLCHQENIIIADTAITFANSIVDLISNSDKAKKLGSELNKKIAAEYGLDVQKREALNILY
jgi:glycosyltransferase involved in cell wall biosynthesis